MSARLIRGELVLRPDLTTGGPADVLVEEGFIQAIEPLGKGDSFCATAAC